VSTASDGLADVFKTGGICKMDRSLRFSSRHNLTFDGNGATLRPGFRS
jgi:hypothetical protein